MKSYYDLQINLQLETDDDGLCSVRIIGKKITEVVPIKEDLEDLGLEDLENE